MSRGGVVRYLGWQIMDRTALRLIACLIISAAIMVPIRVGTRTGPPAPEMAVQLLTALHQQFAFVFMLLFTNGIIAEDRRLGFFRFYFAKPVSPLWFYAQHIGLGLVAMLAASAAFATMFALTIAPVWHFSIMANALALFLLAGMLVVMFSALSRYDWLWMFAVLAVASTARGRWPAGESTLGSVLHAVLPPNHLIGASVQPDRAGWLWIGAWALGLFALTMLLLARRPLGED